MREQRRKRRKTTVPQKIVESAWRNAGLQDLLWVVEDGGNGRALRLSAALDRIFMRAGLTGHSFPPLLQRSAMLCLAGHYGVVTLTKPDNGDILPPVSLAWTA